MRKLFSLITALSSFLASANAAEITVNVNGASGPWDISLNPTYSYGVPDNGQNNINLAPTVVSSLSGLPFAAYDSLTISSLTPGSPTLLAGAGGFLWSDANGVRDAGWPPTGAGTPAQYIPGVVYLEELVGVFANNGVIVGTPFAIGNGPTTVVIPSGANQLLMGVSDGWYNDNGGSVNVKITEISNAVPEVSSTFLLLSVALAGIAFMQRMTRPVKCPVHSTSLHPLPVRRLHKGKSF